MSSAPTTDPRTLRVPGVRVAGVIDLILVTVFVLIGRASHGEGLAGLQQAVLPFLIGVAIGNLAAIPFRAPYAIRWAGLLAWAGAVVGGLVIRAIMGQGIQLSFVIVTTLVLGAFLLGWRFVRLLVVRAKG